MEVDLVDSETATPVETLKKPVKQVPIKKEVSDEMTLSNMLSATSMVWMQWNCSVYMYALLETMWQYLTYQGLRDGTFLFPAKANHLVTKSFQLSSKIVNDHYWSFLSTVSCSSILIHWVPIRKNHDSQELPLSCQRRRFSKKQSCLSTLKIAKMSVSVLFWNWYYLVCPQNKILFLLIYGFLWKFLTITPIGWRELR